MNLQVKSRLIGTQAAVVELAGEVDVYTVPNAKKVFFDLIGEGVRHFIVDLTAADYLDSTALGALVGVLKRVAPDGGSVRLLSPQPRVRRVFEITRLDQVFPIHATEQEAVESVIPAGESGR